MEVKLANGTPVSRAREAQGQFPTTEQSHAVVAIKAA